MPAIRAGLNCEIIQREIGNRRTGAVLQVEGGIDLTTLGDLRDAIQISLAAESVALLIVDMRRVTHIDSSGIGTLLEGFRNAAQRHVRFVLCGMPPTVLHVFQRTRLHLMFDICQTIEEALLNPALDPRAPPDVKAAHLN